MQEVARGKHRNGGRWPGVGVAELGRLPRLVIDRKSFRGKTAVTRMRGLGRQGRLPNGLIVRGNFTTIVGLICCNFCDLIRGVARNFIWGGINFKD